MKILVPLEKPAIYATLALLAVFTIDLFAPLGIAVSVLYLLCFFLVCRQNKKIIIVFAIITSLLSVTKYFIFYSPVITPFAFYNRIISVAVIIIIALLALKHRKLIDAINEERRLYINEIEQMIFKTSHKVRKPVANCLGLMNLLETKQPMTVEELNKIVSHFKTTALELDEFTKELTIFILDIKTKEEMPQIQKRA